MQLQYSRLTSHWQNNWKGTKGPHLNIETALMTYQMHYKSNVLVSLKKIAKPATVTLQTQRHKKHMIRAHRHVQQNEHKYILNSSN